MILAYLLIVIALVILLYDYRSGIITSLLVMTNFGEFIYVNPNLEMGDFGGIGTIYFMDLFWLAMILVIIMKKFDGEYNGRKIYRSNNLLFYNVTLIHYIKFFIF